MDNFFFGDNRISKSDPTQEFKEISLNYSREFSKGKSFKFSIWNETDTYNNDMFVQDFVTYNQSLWACRATELTNIPPDLERDVPSNNNRLWDRILDGVSDIVFDQDGNKIVWRYEDESTWRELIELDIVSESEIKNMLAELEVKLGNTYDKELDVNSINAVQNKAVAEAISNTNTELDNVKKTLTSKQNIISDIDQIRSKANSALQTIPKEYVTESELSNSIAVSEELTNNKIASLDTKKVDKVSGKGLSTNDFTNNFKTKLEGLSNYNDSEVKNLITSETTRAKSAEQVLTNAITTINGTGTGSIKKTVADEIAKVIDSAPEAFDTLKEIADYINEDQEAATVIANDLIEHSNAIEENKSEIVTITKNVTELSQEKADKNGKYANLTAGDLYGHGESVEAEFSFRASGGKSIKDGTAYVKEIQGNSVVWNQLAKNFVSSVNEGGWHIDGAYTEKERLSYDDENHIVTINGKDDATSMVVKQTLAIPSGHKVLLSYGVELKSEIERTGSPFLGYFGSPTQWITTTVDINSVTNKKHLIEKILTLTSDVSHIFLGVYSGSVSPKYVASDKVCIYSPRIIDLTKMFGAGNEPSTIEEYNARKPIVADEYAYNEGEVIPFRAEGIKSVGDNAWDEEWEVGSIGDNNGNLISSSSTIRSKNYIKAIGGNEYYFGYFGNAVTWGRVHYYDAEKNRIGSIAKTVNASSFIPPLNCAYMKFRMGDGYGTTYKNDITISLYHSGWKAEVDNTYKPYWADTLMLDARIKEAFPNGMYRAGSAYDVVRYNAETKQMEAVKRIKAVKMKDLNWSLYTASNNNTSFTASLQDIKQPSTNAERTDGALIAKYYPTTENPNTGGLVDKCWVRVTNNIYIKDDAFASAEAFVNSLNDNDVLYYELAEPIVTPLGEFEMDYKVADFGTEEIISEQNSAPFKGRVIYQFNAVDQIRENYLAIEELKKNGGSGSITIDSALSSSSTNAVQNKVVTTTLNKKVDKVEGKGLSTNDYTTAEKNKLAGLQNYDDAEVQDKLTELSSEVEEINEKIGNLPQGASMTPITYAELVELRDNGKLVAGAFYRITDYITTTAQENTHSANHPFDVIVLALSENTLAEEAYAFQSARDTDGYFANSNLSAWKLWYSLDNDVERFAWADDENGKGVIYRMIDEWNNDLPYDFKNIQFRRKISLDEGYPQFSEEAEETWVYTFCANSYHINNDEWSELKDGSLESPYGHMSDENSSTFHHNSMKPWFMYYNGNDIYQECGKAYLNDNVFLGYWEEIGSGNEEEMLYYYAYCCFGNTFGNYCNYNTFGNNYNYNTFGNNCYSNSFGNNCYSNSFGNCCYSNSFGDYCYSNSFDDECYSNSFGDGCYYNSFGNSCNYNSFGNDCSDNSFGNGCNANTFVDDSDGLAHGIKYCRYDDGVHDVRMYYDDIPDAYESIMNIHIYRGVHNVSYTPAADTEVEQSFCCNHDGEIVPFVLMEIITKVNDL